MADSEFYTGENGKIKIAATGSAPAYLLRITQWSIDETCGEVEGTSGDSGGKKEFKPGNSEFTAQVTALWDPTEAKIHQNGATPPLLRAKTEVDFEFYLDPTLFPGMHWDGSGFITKSAIPSVDTNEQALSYTFNIRGTGTLTWPDQPA